MWKTVGSFVFLMNLLQCVTFYFPRYSRRGGRYDVQIWPESSKIRRNPQKDSASKGSAKGGLLDWFECWWWGLYGLDMYIMYFNRIIYGFSISVNYRCMFQFLCLILSLLLLHLRRGLRFVCFWASEWSGLNSILWLADRLEKSGHEWDKCNRNCDVFIFAMPSEHRRQISNNSAVQFLCLIVSLQLFYVGLRFVYIEQGNW